MSFLKRKNICSIFHIVMVVSFSLSLQACNLERLVSKDKLSSARENIEFILSTDYPSLQNKLVEDVRSQFTPDLLNKFRTYIPKEEPLSVSLVGFNQSNFKTLQTSKVVESYTFQYEFPDKWLLISLVTQTENGREPLIGGFHIKPIKGDLKELNKFNLIGQPVQNYIALIFAVAVPVFIIISLFMCYKTPIPKRKWLWYIFIALGFCAFNLNWTTGQWGIQLLAFQLLGSGFVKSGMYAPVIIQMSIPIGAILFYLKRKKWLEREDDVV